VGQVIRASTPPRGGDGDEYLDSLWLLAREGAAPLTVRAEIVALTDAVELQLTVNGGPRPRLRFLRDTAARAFAKRMHERLLRRGFVDQSVPMGVPATFGADVIGLQ
jgi:hypothetical protein